MSLLLEVLGVRSLQEGRERPGPVAHGGSGRL